MVDRLTNRGNFDDVTEAIVKRCATFQVKITHTAFWNLLKTPS